MAAIGKENEMAQRHGHGSLLNSTKKGRVAFADHHPTKMSTKKDPENKPRGLSVRSNAAMNTPRARAPLGDKKNIHTPTLQEAQKSKSTDFANPIQTATNIKPAAAKPNYDDQEIETTKLFDAYLKEQQTPEDSSDVLGPLEDRISSLQMDPVQWQATFHSCLGLDHLPPVDPSIVNKSCKELREECDEMLDDLFNDPEYKAIMGI